jgi:hypothetical protein
MTSSSVTITDAIALPASILPFFGGAYGALRAFHPWPPIRCSKSVTQLSGSRDGGPPRGSRSLRPCWITKRGHRSSLPRSLCQRGSSYMPGIFWPGLPGTRFDQRARELRTLPEVPAPEVPAHKRLEATVELMVRRWLADEPFQTVSARRSVNEAERRRGRSPASNPEKK